MLYNTHEMPLLDGVHHVTFLTEDIERLAAFYGRVFDAARTFDETEEGVRHGASDSETLLRREWKTVELS